MGVLIISKSFIVREALESFFKSSFEDYNFNSIRVLDEAKDIDFSKIKFMFIDIEDNEIDKIKKMKAFYKDLKILIFDKSNNVNILKKSIKSNIDGYLVDIPEKEELVYIVNNIINGKKYYDLDLIKELLTDDNCNSYDNGINTLTSRESEILELVVEGLTNKEIAKKLYITEHTIKKHITNILFKLDMRNRKELIIYAKINYNI